ncbi:MAG: Glycine-tRNA ligase [Parcubacteria group bacterium GW2011_GWA2_39_18]|nr:MAG: Glycine-tRNA ligase [Parcubacteria group bacterium GW2011_GWA2_39_18]
MRTVDNLMDKVVNLCKRRGFVFPGSEIYGGMANSWDYGPLGVELKNNIKKLWWKKFVQERDDMVGIDAALIMNPKVWEASGHLKEFSDPLVECGVCKNRFRQDAIVQSQIANPDGTYNCPIVEASNVKGGETKTHGILSSPRQFNLMFKTFIGPAEEQTNVAYFRPETAQGMFVDFKNVLNTTRRKIPFGIAQIGKAFRNEITPGNFIFRTREFEQMEIEYFIRETDWEKSFEYWLGEMKAWMKLIGLEDDDLHFAEIPDGERAHYSKRTIDIEFAFPFGMKELYGIAYRTDFDLKNHQEKSGTDLQYQDSISGEKFLPHVIEPTFGVDRTFLAVLIAAYQEEQAKSADGEDEQRIVLKLPKMLAPVQVAVLPLSKKEELSSVAQKIAQDLRKNFAVDYDETQSIGKRYRRQDEIGTPFCVTVDFESLEDQAVTIRDRDSMRQDRIKIKELENYLSEKFK